MCESNKLLRDLNHKKTKLRFAQSLVFLYIVILLNRLMFGYSHCV